MVVIIAIWGVLRYVFAWGGILLFVLAGLTLFDVFTVSIEGDPIAWYWLLIGAAVLGVIGQIGDALIEKSVGMR